ncbi:hypothetical protein [Azospirillum sp. sgz301742]
MTTCAETPAGTSTLIPSIGMTFAEAAARIIELAAAEDALPGGYEANDARDAFHDEWSALRDKVFDAEIQMAADVLAILDILLNPFIGIPTGLASDDEVQAIRQIRKAIAVGLGSPQPANDAPDPFDATVKLLSAAGAAALAIPSEPTDAMVHAGAAAAGITPEAFRAAYAAAIATA